MKSELPPEIRTAFLFAIPVFLAGTAVLFYRATYRPFESLHLTETQENAFALKDALVQEPENIFQRNASEPPPPSHFNPAFVPDKIELTPKLRSLRDRKKKVLAMERRRKEASQGGAIRAILTDPMGSLIKRSYLGSPGEFAGFIQDEGRWRHYLRHPVPRFFLERPRLLKKIVSNATLQRGFFGSAAMQDPETTKKLLGSRFFAELAMTPGGQAIISDPSIIRNFLTSPSARTWMKSHPALPASLAKRLPGLAQG